MAAFMLLLNLKNIYKYTSYTHSCKYSTIFHYDPDPSEKWMPKRRKNAQDIALWLTRIKSTTFKDTDKFIDNRITKALSSMQDFNEPLFKKYGADLAASIFALKIGGAVQFWDQNYWYIARYQNAKMPTNKETEDEDNSNNQEFLEEMKFSDDNILLHTLLSRYSKCSRNYDNRFYQNIEVSGCIDSDQIKTPKICLKSDYTSKEREILPSNKTHKLDVIKKSSTDFTIKKLDFSNSRIMYRGLENLQGLDYLLEMSFSGCAYIDDTCISRLPILVNTNFFQSLDISNCSKITDKGLATLHNLSPGIQRILLKNLISIPNSDKDLIPVLLKKCMPECQFIF
ncbi:unnamed protein product [Gordionus sp. m RMFG-2023]|uniref:distal membrane-arm assembly complex protein 2-like n=1 Tax=Gordionus sp. m RMFG-2023 TaxID=3053472 RepID=UPI0030DEA599